MAESHLNPQGFPADGAVPSLPKATPAIFRKEDLPELPKAIIEDVLNEGDKLLIMGDSKGYKTTLCINLAVAVASGAPLLGFECVQTKVLYVNLEVREEWFYRRVFNTIHALGVDGESTSKHLDILNLRGKIRSIDDLARCLLETYEKGEYGLVILDPVYKLQTGSENEAKAIAGFCAALDEIAEGLGCTILFAHHHAKGSQEYKSVEDRASGSGVFARDPDAMIDINTLVLNEHAKPPANHPDAIPVRLEFVHRSCAPHAPVEGWVSFPAFLPDEDGVLGDASFKKGNLKKFGNAETRKRKTELTTKALFEAMGERVEIDGSEFMKSVDDEFKANVGRAWRTVKKYVDPELFSVTPHQGNRNVISRKTGLQGEQAQQMQALQGANNT